MASVEESISPIETIETTDHKEPTPTTPRALTPIPETDTLSESPATSFHPDADLEVVITKANGEHTTYIVCASALACASPIWRTMLYQKAACDRGANNGTKQDRSETMKLTGDPEAIGVLFRIIHYDFKHVPKEPTLDKMFELAKSVCQYRCAHVLYPWAGQWVASLTNFVAEVDCYSECHKALHVAWTFGELKLYRETVDALIVSAKIDGNGKIVNISGQPLEDMIMPHELLEVITETRASTVAKILDAVKAPIEVLSSGEQNQPSMYCKVGKDSQACEIMMLGSVIPALTKAGIFPVPKPKNFTGSIEALKNSLDKVKTIPYVGKEWMPHMSHEGCNLGFRESVMTCLKEMMVPLGAGIMSWMSDQANICGIKATRELEKWRQRAEESLSEHLTNSRPVQHLEKQDQEECGGDRDSESTKDDQQENLQNGKF
ncbi:hypothetical protein FHL15_008223 [Xylaria flabelliformis]|uniref:BTB domain-containing protein n=1 Tax=Xylaria flabelliformis TaxID=2512241 RepID=A0A553HS81_9PEZI|nr:hypothetical protein FHL15_008223 [Xylaria flabelliformis]